jgi:hypothetical protein
MKASIIVSFCINLVTIDSTQAPRRLQMLVPILLSEVVCTVVVVVVFVFVVADGSFVAVGVAGVEVGAGVRVEAEVGDGLGVFIHE